MSQKTYVSRLERQLRDELEKRSQLEQEVAIMKSKLEM